MHIEITKINDVANVSKYKIKKPETIIQTKQNYIKYYKNVGLLLKKELLIKVYLLLFQKKIY